jgi:hypothetical protein
LKGSVKWIICVKEHKYVHRHHEEGMKEMRREERRQDRKIRQLMQMTLTAVMVYTTINAGGNILPKMFQMNDDSDCDDDKKPKPKDL